ncbi:hypothetical protein EON67_11735 [archaeon]|nr:MAG: hypothetical protein EON67_11735 [archaeon]
MQTRMVSAARVRLFEVRYKWMTRSLAPSARASFVLLQATRPTATQARQATMYASGTLHEFHPRSSSAATSSVPRARGKSSGQSRRWLTEASEAFSYYVPLPMPCDAATLCDASAAVTMLPAELVAEHGIDPAQFSDVDKLFRDDAPQLVNESTQTEAAVTGMKSVLKKAQEEAVAAMRRKREAERRQREKMGSSRFLADSAFVRLHHKPAFHAYGYVTTLPLTPRRCAVCRLTRTSSGAQRA